MNSKSVIDMIKKEALIMTKLAAPPRSARSGVQPASAPAPTERVRAQDTSDDPTAPIAGTPSAAPASGVAPTANNAPANRNPVSGKFKNLRTKDTMETISAIKDMQKAMQGLAEIVIMDASSATMSFKPRDANQPQATDAVRSSKKSFNDFIAEQYLGALDEEHKGVEWDTNTKVTNLQGKQKTQTDIYELDVVMDTLRRVGMSASEFKMDGNWEFRTDNALRNMMSFAYALLQLEGDFGLGNNIYSFSHWKNFSYLLSGYKIENGTVQLDQKEKKERAETITKHLKSIAKLYNHFRLQVTGKPEYRPVIEGKRSFDKYDNKGTNTNILNPEELQYAASDRPQVTNISYIAPGLSSKKLDFIPLKALRSKQDYLKWMLDYAGVPSEDMAIKIFNNVIKPKIDSL